MSTAASPASMQDTAMHRIGPVSPASMALPMTTRLIRCAAPASLLLLIAIPAATAHGEHDLARGEFLPHVMLAEADLEPGKQENWTLAYEGKAMRQGWHWLIRADVEGVVRADFDLEGKQGASWQWSSGPQSEILVLDGDGIANVTMTNIGSGNATVRWYYDHTCDCSAKPAPLSPGLLWLNVDAQAGDEVSMELFVQPVQTTPDATSMPGNISVQARHVVPDGVGGYVPHATAQKVFDTSDESCDTRHSRWNGCMELAFEATRTGRQLVLVALDDDAPTWQVLVVPNIEVVEGKQAPAPWIWVAVPLAVAVAVRRRT